MTPSRVPTVDAIVPTIGRPESLVRLLQSLARQTHPVAVILADGSATESTAVIADDPCWRELGLRLERIVVQPPHAVRQRIAAIARSQSDYLLFLDDDVVLEDDCVEQLVSAVRRTPGAIGACADFKNQSWPEPTQAWRWYMTWVLGMNDGDWQGRVVGPLLRFGYNPPSRDLAPMQWLSTSGTLVKRSAYDACGGFSDFFLHRSTINEDLDLGLKLTRHGSLMLCPTARLSHFHAPGGRVSQAMAAEDDLFNRFLILRRTLGATTARAVRLVVLFAAVETISNAVGGLRRLSWPGFAQRAHGRLRALGRVLASAGRA